MPAYLRTFIDRSVSHNVLNMFEWRENNCKHNCLKNTVN